MAQRDDPGCPNPDATAHRGAFDCDAERADAVLSMSSEDTIDAYDLVIDSFGLMRPARRTDTESILYIHPDQPAALDALVPASLHERGCR